MKRYLIEDLSGEAWIEAISEVIDFLNFLEIRNTPFFFQRDKYEVEELATGLGIRFNELGEIVKER